MRTTSVKMKILFGTAGLVLILGLAMILLTETLLRAKLDSKLEKRGMAIARSVARDSIDPLLTERYVDLILMTKEVKNAEEDIDYIFIEDARGIVVAHTFEREFPAGLKKLSRTNNGKSVFVQHIDSGGKQTSDITVPLIDGKAGVVHVGLSNINLRQDIDDISRAVIGVIVGLMAIGTGFATWFASRITKPLHLLAIAAEGIERGKLGVRVPVRSGDELGHLANAFNKMAEARMRVEEMRAASEKQLRDITASLGEGVMVLNEEGLLIFMNPEAERLLGWTENEVIGKEMHALTHYQRADGTLISGEECPSSRVLVDGRRVTIEDDVYTRKDGKTFPVAYISAPIVEHGKPVAVVIAFRDITDRKQREADREQLLLAYKDALNNVKTLKGLIPICSSCKKIRDDSGYWGQIEAYIRDHSDAEFSHGICPDCARRLYPEFYSKSLDNPEEGEGK